MLWYLGNIWDYGLQMLPSALAAAAVFFCLRPWRRRRLAALGLTSGPWVFFYAFGQPEYVRSTGVFPRPAMGRARLEEGSADWRVQLPFRGDHTAFCGAEQRYHDLILNRLGALCGYWAFLLLRRLAPALPPDFDAKIGGFLNGCKI